MSKESNLVHGNWSSRWMFILAVSASAIGLGNIWKFPYITGVHGGGAFVITYILCVLVIGIPIMVAEILIGRRSRAAPINAVAISAKESGISPRWSLLGWMGTIAGFLILSFYSMIAGWAIYYVYLMATNTFASVSPEVVLSEFDNLLTNPLSMLFWHSLFMAMTAWVVARGVQAGLEKAVRWLMPALFLLALGLMGYATTTGYFGEGWRFMFSLDFSKLGGEGWITAMGHAFFTLSLGMGAVMAYGAYMPHRQSIGQAVMAVGVMNTIFAIVMGLAIFPIVFSNGLATDAGPGLMFVTLPLAFGNLPFGAVFGTLFFLLVVIAAWTSAISIAEPFVAWAVERGIKRPVAAGIIGVGSWFLGIFSILSFNTLADDRFHVFGKTFFGLVDYLTTNLMLPLGGLLIAIFAGWIMKDAAVRDELQLQNPWVYRSWKFAVRIVSPLAILAVLVHGLGGW